jgi:hypothetical protein
VRRSRVWPWGIAALVVALGVVVTVLSALAGPHGAPWWENALFGLVVLASVVVGLLVTVRRPGNPIGWLLLANGLAVAVLGVLTFSFLKWQGDFFTLNQFDYNMG